MTETSKLKEKMPPEEFNSRTLGGVQLKYKFANGYGASVISGAYTYGGEMGLLELAVLGPDGRLCYDTPITEDVIGYLDAEKAIEILKQIEALPRR